MSGKVKINTGIREVTRGRKIQHLLSFTVSRPTGFTETIKSRKPESCFKYRRVSLTEPIKNKYLGVCSIDDFMVLPSSASGSGAVDEIFRSSSFFAEYTDYNTALADQKKLELSVWDFYNNLGAYIVSEAGAEAERTYTFPDYTEDLLNSLITRHRMLKYQNQADSDRINIINTVLIPILSANYEMYLSLEEASDLMYNRVEYYKVNLLNVLTLKSGLAVLKTGLTNYTKITALQTAKINRIMDLNSELESAIESVVSDEDDLLALKNLLARVRVESKVSDPVDAPDESAVAAAVVTITPGMRYLENVETSSFTDTSTVDTLLAMVKKFGVNLDAEIKLRNAEVESLQNDIEIRKGEIQDVEARMRSIRPSLDVSNPETAWYLTVNIDNR